MGWLRLWDFSKPTQCLKVKVYKLKDMISSSLNLQVKMESINYIFDEIFFGKLSPSCNFDKEIYFFESCSRSRFRFQPKSSGSGCVICIEKKSFYSSKNRFVRPCIDPILSKKPPSLGVGRSLPFRTFMGR